MINHGPEPFAITRGTRVAQLVIAPVIRAEVRGLPATQGGAGGFGATGLTVEV